MSISVATSHTSPGLRPETHREARPASTALLTDRYELTMLQAALASGVAEHRAAFEVFGRRLPPGRRYGVVAGTDRVVEAIGAFRFGPSELAALEEDGVVNTQTLRWLADFTFTGDVTGYREGEIYVPNSPILTVEATFAEAVILETVILSILNHDTAVATAAARMVQVAGDKPLIEMGGRRTHEQAAVVAARAAYLAGFTSTSNLEAGRRYGIPTVGTAAHAFTLAHRDERTAFDAQLAAFGPATTLLVDTFDVEQGIRQAVAAARAVGAAGPGAVRIDSGDPRAESIRARALLDRLGATATKVIVTGDLDEFEIERLERAGAPIDGYGVGTKLVTGSGRPTAELVYKLVAVADAAGADAPRRSVAKRSTGKATVGGRKRAHRLIDPGGVAGGERLTIGADDGGRGTRPVARPERPDGWTARPLQVPLIRGGEPVATCAPTTRTATTGAPGRQEPDRAVRSARRHHAMALAELPVVARRLDDGPAVFEAVVAPGQHLNPST